MKTESVSKRECSSILHQASKTTNCIEPVCMDNTRVLEKKNLAKDGISVDSRNCLQKSHERGKSDG